MSLFANADRRFASAVSRIAYANPFLPERLHLEREALGDEFQDSEPVWSLKSKSAPESPNVLRLGERVEELTERVLPRLGGHGPAASDELRIWEDLVLYRLYHRFRNAFEDITVRSRGRRAPFFRDFAAEAARFLGPAGVPLDAPHVFSCLFQIRRAFHHIFSNIVGGSLPAARLRAAVWQSIFSHDMRRYRRTLFGGMEEFTTLISGESGTGKELVARAIGLSRFVPFDGESQQFEGESGEGFHPLNLAALSPTLIESELFGHRRGAFTGAIADRPGWLEVCPPRGAVFLDEIGEIDGALQVKLLRVLETREFQRIGDTAPRRFRGKIIAATNRDLAREMHSGRFRPDLYYRLCSDIVVTPTLREQLDGEPGELRDFILFIARRLVGQGSEEVAAEVESWIGENLGKEYAWPGNVRELEQCVKNVLIRREYRPPRRAGKATAEGLASAIEEGTLSADDLLRRYVTMTFSRTGNYEETARRLGLDRRTVKSRVDPGILAELRRGAIGLRETGGDMP